MILGPKVGVLPSLFAKKSLETETITVSVQPAIVDVQEGSICVCTFREPE